MTLITSPIDEVISNEKLSDVGMENMQVAKRNADRMLRLINQILDFARYRMINESVGGASRCNPFDFKNLR